MPRKSSSNWRRCIATRNSPRKRKRSFSSAQQHQLEQAEFFLKSAKLSAAQTTEVTLPRREITVREAVQLTLSHDKAQSTLPLSLSQKRIGLEKLKQSWTNHTTLPSSSTTAL
jgi:hypothetical protein